ncbi:hypothetical protein XBKQ1_2100072 [Xenorhabdus bovienii str. kraussei Quebec]|uniref:Uncharacterized protein n=1 Tax=Xenorhabdus bovienii str. kraussei Quebec TaxID=1398203 RepID=A0A077PFF2_XENBV|nr:hypothetical protein XBKQ1_2100072 [Xenorhabdus bovienii str. kraussei Quebec]
MKVKTISFRIVEYLLLSILHPYNYYIIYGMSNSNVVFQYDLDDCS